MKKIITILNLSLFASSNLFAAERSNQIKFNKWLSENGYNQYLTEQIMINIKIKNKSTLIYILENSYRDRSGHLKSLNRQIVDFKNLIEDKSLKKQMKTKGILSYFIIKMVIEMNFL